MTFICTTLACVLSYTGGTLIQQSSQYATIRLNDGSFLACVNRNPTWDCPKGDTKSDR
jgi:hypothetical protein